MPLNPKRPIRASWCLGVLRRMGHTRGALWVWLVMLTFYGTLPAAALAADGDPTVEAVRLGFDGQYKVGHWTPIEITIAGGKTGIEGQLIITVPDGDGVPTLIPHAKPVAALAGQTTTVRLYAKIGQDYPEITVELHAADRRVRSTFKAYDDQIPVALDASRPLVLMVGRPLGVVSRRSGEGVEQSTMYAPMTAATDFPLRWYGYDAANTVILCTSDVALYRQLTQNGPQMDALDIWVRLGGRLILCVGSEAAEVLAENSPLLPFVPGKFTGTVPLRRANAWESYVGTGDRLELQAVTDAEGESRLTVPRLEDVRGRIEAYEGSRSTDLPLVVRAAHGLGEVVFVAADLDRAPFLGWPAREQLLLKLLGKPEKSTTAENTDTSAVGMYGYTDMAGQLRAALEQFEGVKLVPFSLVAALIVLYIVAIGPLDYLLLKRGFKRMEWTWFTFPAIVLAFSATAYVLAYWLKGDQLLTNQVDILDYDAETRLVRGTTWTNLFSPQVDTYDLQYQPVLPGDASLAGENRMIAWTGLPGDSFAGMSSPGGAAGLFTGGYAFSPTFDRLQGMPIAVWSTKGVTGRWYGEAEPPILAELTDQGDGMLAGSVQSRLDEPLQDCVLVYGRWAYPIRTLDARARFSVQKKLDPQTVETYFKRISLYNEQDPVSTYDPTALEVDRIVEGMMFHEHLGGVSYARLTNEYQQFVDLSKLLRCGRAILVGRGPRAGAQLRRGPDQGEPVENAGDRRWTYYRFVFPVKNTSGD